jgi:dipeptidyl aminopeptidase/acylaminoacyl peptidase
MRSAMLLSICSLILLCATSSAQEAAERERLFRLYLSSATFVKENPVTPYWLPDGKRFLYAGRKARSTAIYLVDPQANTKRELWDSSMLDAALLERPLVREDGNSGVPAEDGSAYRGLALIDGETKLRFTYRGKTRLLTLADKSLKDVPPAKEPEKPRLVRAGYLSGEPATMEVPSPDGKWFATEKNHNLALRKAGTEEVTLLTTDGIKDHAWSVNFAVWSPDSTKLVVSKNDIRHLPKYPVVQWLKPSVEVSYGPRTTPGGPLPRQEMYSVDVTTRKQTRIDASKEDHSLLGIRWTPDGSYFLLTRTHRSFNKVELLAATPRTGQVCSILTENSDTFVATPLFGPYHVPFLADGKRFLWLSERTGWNHIYLGDLDGQTMQPLTQGNWPVVRIVEVDEQNGWVYFIAHGNQARPYDTHLYRVSLSGSGLVKLTEAPGQHDYPHYLTVIGRRAPVGVQLSPSKEFFLDTHSSIDRPSRTELRKADGTLLQVLEEADISGLKQIRWQPPEAFVVKAADGKTDLHGVLYKPYDFDPQKKYPVLDYIYNGPQTTWVPRTFNDMGGLLAQAMAQLGYIIFIVDGRGTPERGKAFQDVVYGKFGQHEIPDHVATLQQLAAQRPYMDLQRVGIYGGSFGGYMTVRAMLTAPEVYRAGIAIAPVYDQEDMPAAVERYMGTPHEKPEGWKQLSSLPLAGKLQGKLLILHGTSDVNAPFSGTMRMVAAFIRAGKRIDMQILPEETHGFAGASQVYMLTMLRSYFAEHLKP